MHDNKMAAPFKIPKKKQSEGDNMQMLSPLSRIQDANSHFKTSNWSSYNGVQHDKSHPVNGHSSRADNRSTPNKPTFREVVRARLEIHHPMRSKSSQPTAYQKSGQARQDPGSHRGDTPEHSKLKTQQLQKTWRPKRASDRLCRDENQETGCVSPQRKTHRTGQNDSSTSLQPSPLETDSDDSGPELPAETTCSSRTRTLPGATSLGEAAWRKQNLRTNGTLSPSTEEDKTICKPTTPDLGRNGNRTHTRFGTLTSGTFRTPALASPRSGRNSDEDAVSPARLTSPCDGGAARTPLNRNGSSATKRPSPQKTPPCKPGDWRARRERAQGAEPKHLSLHLRLKGSKHASTEPIVLSSDEEAEMCEQLLPGPSQRTPQRGPSPPQRGPSPPLRGPSQRTPQRGPSPPQRGPSQRTPQRGPSPPQRGPSQRTPQRGPSPPQRGPSPPQRGPSPPSATLAPGAHTQTGEKASVSSQRDERPGSPQPPPPILELPFVTLHAGGVRAEANGNITITDDGITLPLKDPGSGREGEGISVSLVASQLRGYGLWEGAVAQSGSVLRGWEGPAPSLLFLWVSHAQAALIQTELSTIHPVSTSGQPCPFLLLVLQDQLGELQAALLASMLAEEAFSLGSSQDLHSPLSWAEGLALIHSCPQEEQLLALLGPAAPTRLEDRAAPSPAQDGLGRLRSSHRSREPYSRTTSRLQGLPTRLIQYPSAPSKGRITVTTEDLECLDSGQFLNDVIIDFYLKYLLLEWAGGELAERCHVFSSFFYKQLTRCDTASEEAAAVPPRNRRHQRVKTWTRSVDIFNKDYLFVPVNHEAHWYLVIICFPGLEDASHTAWPRPAPAGGSSSLRGRLKASEEGSPGGSAPPSSTPERGAGCIRQNPSTHGSHNPPECTQDGCQRETICKRPCILVMDSLKLSYHERIFKLLREYLQVEWEVRKRTPRDFTADNMKSSHCRVPLQDNSSDCGLYLLQYVESFLQNPVVHFDLPVRLEHWFPRQRVWRKREEIRRLVMQLHGCQGDHEAGNG
ncbi:sentrin-specific protease 7b [Hypomesus transpacificus]|uniref:sentrin-specific protease 7b n=1 Tax=Hypomesus transpacificus TaxID=137520 RepID=UPI001F07348D|nr:sentrin-specific protease 7b [Hypomesus transpacificus]